MSKTESEINKLTLSLYWEQIRKFKISFIISLLLIPASALFIDTLLPYFLSQSIGGLSNHDKDIIYQNLLIAGIISILGVICNFIGFRALVQHEAKVKYELAKDTFKKIVDKDFSFFVNEKIGSLTSRYIDFIQSHMLIQDLLVIRTLTFLVSVTVGLFIVGSQSIIVAAILFILLLSIVVQAKVINKFRPFRDLRKKLSSETVGVTADALTNNLLVKTFANEDIEIKNISKINAQFKNAYIKDFDIIVKWGSARILTMSITQLIAIGICTSLVFDSKMTIAVALFILVYLQRISTQIFSLGEMLNGYDKALLQASPMSEILASENSIKDHPNPVAFNNIDPIIEFKNVSYKYTDSSDYVLKDINLIIKSGEKVGIVGHSGAGKTTITNLLLRFSDVSKGSILIDHTDIRDIAQKDLRHNIAFVPQESMLFHRTLRENIIYGKPDASDNEITAAIKKANIYDFVSRLPKGLDTIVGERGIKLSGGQRQRIAIARALLKDAPILILDEATSALDSKTEKMIQDSLKDLMKGRTSIVIAHRLSTIAKLDRIIVIEDGKILEDGTHSELLSANKTYAKLWAHQSGGFIEE